MSNLYNRILKRLAVHHIDDAFNEGYHIGLGAGANDERLKLVRKLEKLEIEKFNNTGVSLGYNTALELVKER